MTTLLAIFGGWWLALSLLAVVGFVVEERRMSRQAAMRQHPSSPTRQARTYVDVDAAGRWTTFDDELVARLVRGEGR